MRDENVTKQYAEIGTILPALNVHRNSRLVSTLDFTTRPETLLYSSGSHLDTFQTITGTVSKLKEILFVTNENNFR